MPPLPTAALWLVHPRRSLPVGSQLNARGGGWIENPFSILSFTYEPMMEYSRGDADCIIVGRPLQRQGAEMAAHENVSWMVSAERSPLGRG